MRDWFYNELDHVGVDYSQKTTAKIYDEQMECFRDYEREAKIFIDKLDPEKTKNFSVIDLGCGTGAFAVYAAKYLKVVHAVDVSEEMLKIAKSKADAIGASNIKFHHCGFLQFNIKEKADVVFSKWAFHHLPDYWKQAALININRMLKAGGIFLLIDVVFKYDPDFENTTEHLLRELSREFRKDFIEEIKIHIREEYSTFDWILRGLIERAGFIIEKVNAVDALNSEYFCRKTRVL
jgi:ubiquinone/menaquinone biosynthesis C-methylase UbiE